MIKEELLSILTEVMKADGNISPEEEKELYIFSTIISQPVESESKSIRNKVITSIKRTNKTISDVFSTKKKG